MKQRQAEIAAAQERERRRQIAEAEYQRQQAAEERRMAIISAEEEARLKRLEKDAATKITRKERREGNLTIVETTLNYVPPKDGEFELVLFASPPSWADGSIGGHAFACIKTFLRAGVKEDCYGFYPKPLSPEELSKPSAAKRMYKKAKAIIHGPGIVQSEFTLLPTRFASVKAEVTRRITAEQRAAVLKEFRAFSDKKFWLSDHNCIELVDQVAKLVGLETPGRSQMEFPLEYLKALERKNR